MIFPAHSLKLIVPFTPSHLVAVLPFWPLRHWLPFAGLAIGAMVPDIASFFPVIDYAQSHSPSGIFTTCLPIGVAIFFLFDSLMRRPLVALLPKWFQLRIDTNSRIPTSPQFRQHLFFYVGLASAIAVGALTHQIWDAFTHKGRWGTDLIPSLNDSVPIAGYNVPGYKLFQYGSTVVGLPILALATMFLLRRSDATHPAQHLSARTRTAILLSLCILPLLVGAFALSTQSTLHNALGATIRYSGAIVALICVAYCIGFHVFCGRIRDK